MASITTTSAPAAAPPERHSVDEVLPAHLMATYGLQHATLFIRGLATQDELFGAPPEEQLELTRAYPRLGQLAQPDDRAAEMGITWEDLDDLMAVSGLRPESLHDQSAAGLDRLSPEEFEQFTARNDAYEQRFGVPLIVAVRAPGQAKETIRKSGFARLENSPAQEGATALVEIAKIANLRLSEVVGEPDEPAQVVVA